MSEAKCQLVQSWLIKAQHDLASAHVLTVSEPPLLDTAVYHCQQAAEKAVKGFLVFCDQEFERIHDVQVLIQAAIPYAEAFAAWQEAGQRLTPFATLFRYPGLVVEPSPAQFVQAIAIAEGLYNLVLSLLPDNMRPPAV
ncbi:MAG: HEPN domain-containing protein [Anaerolineae bacterium]|nr:HEPN domain-containing protein [Anaerolineae bacterium]